MNALKNVMFVNKALWDSHGSLPMDLSGVSSALTENKGSIFVETITIEF